MNRQFSIFLVFALLLLGMFSVSSQVHADAVWQWSVPAPSIPDRRAFLWIPQNCKHVRGVVVAVQNMLEEPLFERPAFRSACAENDLGLLLIRSGHDRAPDDDKNLDHPKRSALDIFLNPNYPNGDEDPMGAGQDLQKVLDNLATVSGYRELRNIPLMPVGHSSAGSFVWHLYRWDPSRIFAMMPFKTGTKDDGPSGIPVFNVESEWFDYGNGTSNVWSNPDGRIRARNHGNCLFGQFVDFGNGHCNVSDSCIPMVALWFKEVVAARIPANAPLDGPVALKPVAPESGWLLDAAALGQPGVEPVKYADYKGDATKAMWYLDKPLATAAQDTMIAQRAKLSQQINFIPNDGSAPPTSGGTFSFSPKFIDDQGTFEVNAAYIDGLTTHQSLFPDGTVLTNSGMPIYYRVNSGALVQVGPNRFRMRIHGGPIVPQGNPWEPTIVAYTLGNDKYQPTERPGHVNIGIVNTWGTPQTITFPSIRTQTAKNAKPISLTATASSGLPVEYYIISGPVTLGPDGKSLIVQQIPPRSAYPVHVMVGAFQWGRNTSPLLQSAGPVVQEFVINK